MFWIYGGGNVAGSTQAYAGLDNLPRLENVCLIAANYRLGIFGYLVLSELAEADPRGTAGNYGLTDLQAALQWVQVNARDFGCDPAAVMLYGQSSGGTNILALMANNGTASLATAAVSLSGSPNISALLPQTEALHRPVCAVAGGALFYLYSEIVQFVTFMKSTYA